MGKGPELFAQFGQQLSAVSRKEKQNEKMAVVKFLGNRGRGFGDAMK